MVQGAQQAFEEGRITGDVKNAMIDLATNGTAKVADFDGKGGLYSFGEGLMAISDENFGDPRVLTGTLAKETLHWLSENRGSHKIIAQRDLLLSRFGMNALTVMKDAFVISIDPQGSVFSSWGHQVGIVAQWTSLYIHRYPGSRMTPWHLYQRAVHDWKYDGLGWE